MLAPMSQRWVTVTLVCVAAVAVATDLSRLEAPQGDRYVNYMVHWPSDFRANLEATRALVAGLNPYRQTLPGAISSESVPIDGVTYHFFYLPTHLLLYVPIALVTSSNDVAAHAWFYVVLLLLFALAAMTWRLAGAITPTPGMALALVFVLIALQPGTLLAVERLQSDLVIAFSVWLALLLLLRGRFGAAAFVAVAAAMVKPHAALFALGVVALGVDRRRWKPIAAGTAAALALLFAPVARFSADAVRAIWWRAGVFWANWSNWGLADVAHAIHPRFVGVGRVVLCALCLAAAVACWIRLRRALAGGDAPERALWSVLFTVCALETVLGSANMLFTYAMVLVEPGLLVLALAQPYVHDRLALSPRARVAAGAWMTLLAATFWLVRPWWRTTTVPLAGFAILGFVVTAGLIAVAELRRARA